MLEAKHSAVTQLTRWYEWVISLRNQVRIWKLWAWFAKRWLHCLAVKWEMFKRKTFYIYEGVTSCVVDVGDWEFLHRRTNTVSEQIWLFLKNTPEFLILAIRWGFTHWRINLTILFPVTKNIRKRCLNKNQPVTVIDRSNVRSKDVLISCGLNGVIVWLIRWLVEWLVEWLIDSWTDGRIFWCNWFSDWWTKQLTCNLLFCFE